MSGPLMAVYMKVTKVNKVTEVKSSFMFRCERTAHARLYESV
ncbi:Uncharacterized protein dnm_027980 [Desulfonema magnum]|uniref:Uncharacterized protein n=1 Tax=Desulfonema magnum TaxID=45655 RepID=A0A975GMJ9_9BACT|nr:Uncharacterized protein dnm_027980 [Desulfonema magnum]